MHMYILCMYVCMYKASMYSKYLIEKDVLKKKV